MTRKGESELDSKIEKDTLTVLSKIKNLLAYTDTKEKIFSYNDYTDLVPLEYSIISEKTEQIILERLEKIGIIKIKIRPMFINSPGYGSLAIESIEIIEKEFEKFYNKYTGKHVEKVIKPDLKIEKNIGYLKFYKEGPKIKIGNIKSRHYRLLQFLTDPLGTAKTIDSVFESIALPKDKKDQYLNDDYLDKQNKIKIIKFTMKELQKKKGLTGKIILEFYEKKSSVALKLIT